MPRGRSSFKTQVTLTQIRCKIFMNVTLKNEFLSGKESIRRIRLQFLDLNSWEPELNNVNGFIRAKKTKDNLKIDFFQTYGKRMLIQQIITKLLELMQI